MINVTEAHLPPLETYIEYLREIWNRGQLTNNGPLVRELEEELKKFLGVRHLFLVSNGTVALQIAIKALGLKGEIVTTPFSYVATTSAIVWEGCRPVFADIHPESWCIDASRIEESINESTVAILATHVYGNPCDVDRIAAVAEQHNLPVVYDAAHAFGVEIRGGSLLRHGTVSTLSFHATKLFHTAEGGAVITDDDGLAHRIEYMRNFGHRGQEDFWDLGINGKSSELHAAMGLCILPQVPELVRQRKSASDALDEKLLSSPLGRPRWAEGASSNYSYYPILFPSEADLLKVRSAMNSRNVFPRRYFYPPLSSLPYVEEARTPIAETIARRVLCLPLYPGLTSAEIDLIAGLVLENLL